MMRRNSLFVPLILAIVAVGIAYPRTTQAAPNPGITVSPAQIQFRLSKDAKAQTVPVTITNSYTVPVSITGTFKGVDEDAGLLIPTDTVDAPFVEALSLQNNGTRIPAGGSVNLLVTFTNTDKVAPGGHYATLVLSQQATSSKQVALRSAVSLTVFGVKTEGLQQSLRLQDIEMNGFVFRIPSRATLTYVNTGNVHVIPRAVVTIAPRAATSAVSKGISNTQSQPVLPGRTLRDEVSMQSIRHTWLPSHMQLAVAYRIDGADTPLLVTQQFWYVPPVYLLLAIAVLWFVFRRTHAIEKLSRVTAPRAHAVAPAGQPEAPTPTSKPVQPVVRNITVVRPKTDEPTKQPAAPKSKPKTKKRTSSTSTFRTSTKTAAKKSSVTKKPKATQE